VSFLLSLGSTKDTHRRASVGRASRHSEEEIEALSATSSRDSHYSVDMRRRRSSIPKLHMPKDMTNPLERRVHAKYCGPIARAEFFHFYHQIYKDRQRFTKAEVGIIASVR